MTIAIVEATDDYPIDDIVAPQLFARSFEWQTFEDTGIKPEELPRPTTWHVLVMPKQPRKISKGGIALPSGLQVFFKNCSVCNRLPNTCFVIDRNSNVF